MRGKRIDYLKRINAIQEFYEIHPGAHVNDLIEYLQTIPIGTISSTLSFMERSGHLVQTGMGYYKNPDEISPSEQVAKDILKFKTTPTLFNQKAQKMFINESAPVNDAKAVNDAIALLKSKGMKVLKSVTEFIEI
jgi:hypothetical protein